MNIKKNILLHFVFTAFENPYIQTTTSHGTTDLNGNFDDDNVKNPRLVSIILMQAVPKLWGKTLVSWLSFSLYCIHVSKKLNPVCVANVKTP